jgi:hypothetical protein
LPTIFASAFQARTAFFKSLVRAFGFVDRAARSSVVQTAVAFLAIFVGIVSAAQASTGARSQTQWAPGTPVTSVRWHAPPTQVSVVQGSPSGQSRAQVAGHGSIELCMHPVAGLQPSTAS